MNTRLGLTSIALALLLFLWRLGTNIQPLSAVVSLWRVASPSKIAEPAADQTNATVVRNIPKEPFPWKSPLHSNSSLALQRSALPKWMKEYFQWHRQRLDEIKQSNWTWTDQRVLISRCLTNDRCGGTADRLRALPYFLALAAKTHRLLFYRWSRPYQLEEFLLPGPLLNWTVPADLEVTIRSQGERGPHIRMDNLMEATHNETDWLVEGMIQEVFSPAVESQMVELGEEMEKHMFEGRLHHDVFWGIFVPVPGLQHVLEYVMENLNLVPNEFISAHYRAFYPGEAFRETRSTEILRNTSINALHCAMAVGGKHYPIYLAADVIGALQAARKYSKQSGYRVVSHIDVPRAKGIPLPSLDGNAPHLNFAVTSDPTQLYPVFLDLLILSLGRCASIGSGGFGRLGAKNSFNASCYNLHTEHKRPRPCPTPQDDWVEQ